MPKLSFQSMFSTLFLGLTLLVTPGCTKKPDPLTPGTPLLRSVGVLSINAIDHIEMAMRTPSATAWQVRLEKGNEGKWMLTARSDLSGAVDRADGKLIGHFLETLSTLTTEAFSDPGSDSGFGFQPFRVEIRVHEGEKETILHFGDPSGDSIYFRRPGETDTWIARGALIPFLGNLRSPAAFQLKSPFSGEFDGIAEVEMTKPGSSTEKQAWKFDRPADAWMSGGKLLSPDQSETLERILRQRILGVVDPKTTPADRVPTLPTTPDWTVQIAIGPERRTETLSLFFILDQIYATNPARSDRVMELYPEAAGALRVFTQARFTPVKSSIK